jgi:citrate lyase beta subunit
MLFVSGEKPGRFQKALDAGADLVCVDLEDAVHPDRKDQARQDVLAFAAQRAPGRCKLAVRLNALRTREGLADVHALVHGGVRFDAVVLPKTEQARDLALFQSWAGDCFDALVALVETPLGIENAASIAGAVTRGAPGLAALMLGGADLSLELGAAFDWDGLLSARARLVNAARSAGLQCWDVPHLDLDRLDALEDETRRVLRLGFTCKTAIHPSQIPSIHRAFAPAEDDVRWAQALLAASAAHSTAGAFLFEGKMVDAPVLARARRIAQLAGS